MLDTHSIYTGLDRIALVATPVRSTPQSRAIRLSQKRERQESYLAATVDAVQALPDEDRVLATAVLQVLHTTTWLEMRVTGTCRESKWRATSCAISALLKDLRARHD